MYLRWRSRSSAAQFCWASSLSAKAAASSTGSSGSLDTLDQYPGVVASMRSQCRLHRWRIVQPAGVGVRRSWLARETRKTRPSCLRGVSTAM
jgi:hypothetical protein